MGFLGFRFKVYFDRFDIVLVDDQTMNVLMDIVKTFSES